MPRVDEQTTTRPGFVLGGAQLGLAYGIANRNGMLSDEDALKLIGLALQSGVRCIDTARAYGRSEHRVGLALAAHGRNAFDVVTKLDPLSDVDAEASQATALEAACRSLSASLCNLADDRLGTLLLHRADHRSWWNGAVWEMLKRARDEGRIGRLGVSVQTPEEARLALGDPDVAHIQLPFNLLDTRWETAGVIGMLAARPEVVVHVRSVLLQGLLSGRKDLRWPQIPDLSPQHLLSKLATLANELGSGDLLELSIRYARSQPWVHGIVVGIDSQVQLGEILEAFRTPPLDRAQCDVVARLRPEVPPSLLNPALWPSPVQY